MVISLLQGGRSPPPPSNPSCDRDADTLLPNARRVSLEFHPDNSDIDGTVSWVRNEAKSVAGKIWLLLPV